MSSKMNRVEFKKFVKGLTVPEGFKLSFEDQTFGWGRFQEKMMVGVLRKDDGSITLRFDQNGCGHTLFLKGETEVTFDRLGVEDSFYSYHGWGKIEKNDLNEIVKEQLEKIVASLEYAKTALTVPGTQFSLSPDRLAAYKKELRKKGGMVRFFPSGFGTGYIFGKNLRGYGVKRASSEQEKFFDASPLFYNTFDAD